VLLATQLATVFDAEREVLIVPPEETFDAFAEAGFDGISLAVDVPRRPGGEDPRRSLYRTIPHEEVEGVLRSLRSHVERLGMRVVLMHGPHPSVYDESPDLRLMTDLSHQTLRWAAVLGVSWVVFHPVIAVARGPFDSEGLQNIKSRNMMFFRELLDTAEEVGVGIAIENLPDNFGPSKTGARRRYGAIPAELIELVDELAHPLVGICWDTGHAQLQHLVQDEALRAIGHRLKATHIDDNVEEADLHLLPYQGYVDWNGVMAALRDIGYQGAFCFEVRGYPAASPADLTAIVLNYQVQLGRYLLTVASGDILGREAP
jgi:sugar phosphate isomerase/epimerase